MNRRPSGYEYYVLFFLNNLINLSSHSATKRYSISMKIKYTNYYEYWFERIKDSKIRTTITRRIDRIKYSDHLGDYKVLETNLYELRFFIHSGIRIYFTLKDDELIILLIGGSKDTQAKDISKAREILKELNNG